jgi:hypothetical protein
MHIKLSLLRFARPSRTDPVFPVPDPFYIRPLPSPNTDKRGAYPDRLTVLSQWRRLDTLDPKSHTYARLLKRLVDVQENRILALEFTDGDASAVVNIIDGVSSFNRLCLYYCTPYSSAIQNQALRGNVLHSKLARHSFSMLRKLAGNTAQLPYSYLVSQDADYRVEETIFACGGFADVRRGTLAKRPVAVKTIRIAQDRDVSKIRKVSAIMRKLSLALFDVYQPPILGFLQGICALDEHIPS